MTLASIVDRWNVPGYNYFFEIGALIFLFILLVKYFYHKHFPTLLTKIFISAIIVAMVDIAVDITASVLVEDYIYQCPIWINELFNRAFYLLQVALPCLMFVYLLTILGPKYYRNKNLYLFLIPGIIFALMIFIDPATHWVCYFADNAQGVLTYTHGPLFLCYYGTAIFYFGLIAVFAGIKHKELEKKQLIALYISIAAILIGIGIQIAYPTILLTGITISVALYFIEDNISNPDDLVDKITGVFNFNALMLYLEKTTKESRENFIVTINIKGIEEINETLGIVTGNELYGDIGSFFNSLQKNFYAFRVFSSKFVLLFKTKNDAENAIGAIKHRFEKPWEIKNIDVMLSCRLVEFTDNGKNETCNQFLNYTNLLSESFDSNKEILYVDSSHIEKISRELKIQKILSDRLNGDCAGFSMRYQPILNNKTGKFDNAEALLRFTCEEFGNIPPAEFVPLAEKAGLANLLDEYVTRTVCAFLKKHPEISFMEINVSGAEFFANPAKKFIEIIKESKVDPSRICFEITETATVKHPEHISGFMNALKNEGVKFAIDDFGTGYSNVSQLLNQPFNIIKLDKSLLENSKKTRFFLESMRSLFKSINYPVVIEGVETKEQLEYAKKLDFDYIQGYYFAQCLTEDEYLAFLKEHK